MNTKRKGDQGIGRAVCAFTAHGWTVCVPITDSQDYDLVVDMPDVGLKRIQVKYVGAITGSGSYSAKIGVRGGTKGGIWKTWDKMEFDYIFLAAADGSDWLVPRSAFKDSLSVSRTGKNKAFEFGCRKPAVPADGL